ncbi:glycoside hydrolase family 2 protein [Cohnella sp. WQ 127256]|uniref:glycoside hydrolase family 2 protein n=1 Tax=Cohnella sp. WQ 127256 TaxID=2938790 RepID=UPI002119460B|nr:glycoside hydrolase family 2 TIM barrel-domain containing protein [Cohnella sp. WQ 127256]
MSQSLRKKELEWTVGWSRSSDMHPDKMVPAIVPGAVQLDWARAEGWGDHGYVDHLEQYAWMEDCFWTYSAILSLPELEARERLYFVCKGVDYRFKVLLNGDILHEQEGMFTPFEIDLTGLAVEGDELRIVVFPAPKREGASPGREQADQSCKPAVSYGWDWHPRLVPLGIWDDTYLETRAASHIESFETFYRLSSDLQLAEIDMAVQLSELPYEEGVLRWTLTDRHGAVVASKEIAPGERTLRIRTELVKPELWWPAEHGDPVLYESAVEWTEGGRRNDRKRQAVGFRTVRLVMHPGAWQEPSQFPKSRSNPPIMLEVNGREIFCKGSNWVNPEIFPGTIREQTYGSLLKLTKDANMNLLRSWGGGIINKDVFFQLCDEMGLMVWQEFPLACNNYVGTDAYLQVLDQESKSIIHRLRSHCSVVMWCGGNELFNSWSGMTDQSLALRLLNKNCYELDPQRPFLMTSPLMGMAHGHYKFRDDSGEEVYQWMARANNTAYTEFGVPGPSSAEYIRQFIPESELFPPRPGTAWETHHAFGAWLSDDWLNLGTIEHYFGPCESLEQLVERGQWLQAEGYKAIYEEARRQKPKCSMALNWCFNEPWPTAANNSLVNWPAEPKPAYEAVKASCRPVLASARIEKFAWTEGEMFAPELWVLNDCYEDLLGGTVEAVLNFGPGEDEVPLLEWNFAALEPNANRCGPIVRYVLPHRTAEYMTLKLRIRGREEWDSLYTLQYTPSLSSEESRARLLNM